MGGLVNPPRRPRPREHGTEAGRASSQRPPRRELNAGRQSPAPAFPARQGADRLHRAGPGTGGPYVGEAAYMMAVASVETSLPIWLAPLEMREMLLAVWWQRRKKDQDTAQVGEWERQIGRR